MNEDVLSGALLGTALGDALGLPCEGMSAKAIARRFGRVDRFYLIGPIGLVSDDTEQSALLAQALAGSDNLEDCIRLFRRSLLGWFLRLPWGIGLGTLRACTKIALGFENSGVRSAGNGAAMRAAILGIVFSEERRLSYGRALAKVTHTDPRAVDGALFVAELANRCVGAKPSAPSRTSIARAALEVVEEPSLVEKLSHAILLAESVSSVPAAVQKLGTSGFVLESLPFALFCFLRFGDDLDCAFTECVGAGGDTDTNAAILGGWLGSLHGAASLPAKLIDNLWDGVFGPTHLRSLARSLHTGSAPPRFSATRAMLRNLVLYPVVLGHGFRRLIPF